MMHRLAVLATGVSAVAAGPTLEIRSGGTGNPQLRWQITVPENVLESAVDVGGPWLPIDGAFLEASVEGSSRVVEDRRPPVVVRFYRLREPGVALVRQPSYDIGSPVWRDIFVDGRIGEDFVGETHDGTTRERAFRTLGRAWRSLPETGEWPTGFRIRLAAGTYPGGYLEDRRGTVGTPVLIEPADGAGTVSFTPQGGEGGNLTFFQSSHVVLQDLTIDVSSVGGDGLQFELCDHVVVRRMTLRSQRGDGQNETLKVNQSRHIYIEDSEITGAGDNCIDVVGAQYGHIVRCRISNAQDWGAYLKGGSAYFLVEGNVIRDCGTGGFTAGQGSGFQFMVPPWLHYEAYDIKVVNNLIHDTEGAGLGVNGGFNILMAHNTLYRVGTRSHVLEFVYGGRTCDGLDVARCQPFLDQGGWGQLSDDGGYFIPNRNILVANNLVYNPAPLRSQWQQLQISGSTPTGPGFTGPSPARGDEGLVITGNVIWNGPADLPLGVEDSTACPPENPDCNPAQLLRDNAFNTLEPDLAGPATADFRPRTGGSLAARAGVALPGFSWADAPTRPSVPPGNLDNQVVRDFNGRARPAGSPPGAFLP